MFNTGTGFGLLRYFCECHGQILFWAHRSTGDVGRQRT